MATVYRTIKALTDEGWLVAVEVPGAPPRYEVRGKAHHHHFQCLKCGKLFELDGRLEHLGKMIPRTFRLVDHVGIIYGFCAGCDRIQLARSRTWNWKRLANPAARLTTGREKRLEKLGLCREQRERYPP